MRNFIPRDYQRVMIDHMLKHPRCAIWAGMGLGKTSAVLKTLDTLSLYEDVYPALICAPLRVARSTWREEVAKWVEFAHLRIVSIVGSKEERLAALTQKSDIYCVNYENIPWLTEYYQDRWPFKTIIADESTKLKGFRLRQGTNRAKSLARMCWSKTTRFIELSGTPAPNGLRDLWGQLWFLDRGERLGRTYDSFESRWFGYQRVKDAMSYKMEIKPIIMPFAQEQIQEKVKDICLSINAKDYFDIQEPIVIPVYIELPPAARKLYKDMEKKMYMEIESNPIEAFNAASRTNKTLQLANGAAYLDAEINDDGNPKAKEWVEVHSEKLQALEDIIEEAAGMPIIVAYNFKSDLARLKKYFPKGRHLKTKKDEDDFKAGKIDLLFLHPKSAAHGIDGFQYITNIIVIFGHDWPEDEYQQVIGRIGPVRQMQAGLDRPVFVYQIIAKNTTDELVIKRRGTKRSVEDILLEATKHYRETH